MSDDVPVNFVEATDWESLPAEEAVAGFINRALDQRASDLFLLAEDGSYTVAMRRFGICTNVLTVSAETGRRWLNHVKTMAGMDLARRMHPNDGRWVGEFGDRVRVDLKINTIPTLHGEDLDLRLLDASMHMVAPNDLGFDEKNFGELTALISRPSGLVLVTGPTGAGKTTTLYSCLHNLNDGRRKINTIEDPVEYVLPGVRQSQVNPRIELDFPDLLRSILRQSPDIIMIGEIRDPVTAQTAIRAANSGHLVFATLHAPVSTNAVDAMFALGAMPYFLANCLIGVVSQWLVRTLCVRCKKEYEFPGPPETFADVRKYLSQDEGGKIYSAGGCTSCAGEGYAGRAAVVEVLRVSDEIRGMILRRRGAKEIRRKAIQLGMMDLRQSALLKIARGETSLEEVMRVVPAEYMEMSVEPEKGVCGEA